MCRRFATALLTMALGITGCNQTGRWVWVPPGSDCTVNGCSVNGCSLTEPMEGPERIAAPKQSLEDARGAPLQHANPPCPEPKAPRTVFVRGPQQKIVIERECAEQPKAVPQRQPERAPEQPPERVAVPGAAQDVILVPRTVYVPYVAQVPTRAARLVTPAGFVQERPAAAPQETPKVDAPKKEETPKVDAPKKEEAPKAPCEAPICPDWKPTTVIELRQMHERLDRLHRVLERITPPRDRP